jgi:hypothetical protein
MTTAPPVRPEAIALPLAGSGERQRRRQERRRLGRQQLLVVLLMILALVVTVAVLAQQWLATGVAGSSTNLGSSTNRSFRPPTPGILSVPTFSASTRGEFT